MGRLEREGKGRDGKYVALIDLDLHLHLYLDVAQHTTNSSVYCDVMRYGVV